MCIDICLVNFFLFTDIFFSQHENKKSETLSMTQITRVNKYVYLNKTAGTVRRARTDVIEEAFTLKPKREVEQGRKGALEALVGRSHILQ